MKAFRLDELEAERAANDGAYLQFLRERNMSVGLYALDAGQLDPQQPHRQDEVYLVVSGRAAAEQGGGETRVAWVTVAEWIGNAREGDALRVGERNPGRRPSAHDPGGLIVPIARGVATS